VVAVILSVMPFRIQTKHWV